MTEHCIVCGAALTKTEECWCHPCMEDAITRGPVALFAIMERVQADGPGAPLAEKDTP